MRMLKYLCFFASLWSFTLSGAAAQCKIRIVSLSPSITHNLQQIGADACIVGRTSYCPPAEKNRNTVTVGNVLEINIEQILALKPDIVFCMAFTKMEIRNTLEHVGITVKDFPTPKDFTEICRQMIEIGELTGFGRQADSVVSQEKLAVDNICDEFRNHPPLREKKRVFFQIGDNPIFPVLEGTFMNDYIRMTGMENIIKEYKGGGISREYVIVSDPDIMFISRMSGTGEQVLRNWQRFGNIRAVKDGHLVLVDDNEACCPTPVFFRKTLQFIAHYLKSL